MVFIEFPASAQIDVVNEAVGVYRPIALDVGGTRGPWQILSV